MRMRNVLPRSALPPIWGSEFLQRQMERLNLQQRVTAWFDIGLSLLAVVMLGLLILELAADLEEPWLGRVITAQLLIWAAFILAFAIELYLAPSKLGYLQTHWLAALSLVVPAFRVFRLLNAIRVLRGVRVVQSFQLVRTTTALNRAAKVINDFFSFSRFAYLLMLTAVLTFTSGILIYYLERGVAESNITSLEDGIWFAVTSVTTAGTALEPAALESRIVAVVLRIFGMAVVGYLTAIIAVFLIGKRESPDAPAKRDELQRLRAEIVRLRETVERQQPTNS